MDKITKPNAELLLEEVQTALEDLLDAYDLALDVGKATFSSTELKMSLSLQVKNLDAATGVNLSSPAARMFLAQPQAYDLPADALGVLFEHHGDRYQFFGVNPRAHPFPLLVIRMRDNTEMRFTRGITQAIREAAASQKVPA